jgi:hypothetical protein
MSPNLELAAAHSTQADPLLLTPITLRGLTAPIAS